MTRRTRHRLRASLLLTTAALVAVSDLCANPLERDLGRAEVRIYSAAFPLESGMNVAKIGLADRLQRLGYTRVRKRPERPGEFFWGHEVFWIFQRAHRHGDRDYLEQKIGLRLGPAGEIIGVQFADGKKTRLARKTLWIEPQVLSESLDADRAKRVWVDLENVPDFVWRSVLAAEDARFFDHAGVDGRSLARAMLANVRAGKVVQGGSTITQQLVKNRALTPARTMTRKANEAVRALVLEAEYEKEHILESYLNSVYLGHVDGLAVHGFGAAARAYFNETVQSLSLEQAALLAAMIQGPNRLSPERHPERARERRDWVLDRLEELEWIGASDGQKARVRPVRTRKGYVGAPEGKQLLQWVAATVSERHEGRLESDLGVVVETTLDPLLQSQAEKAVAAHLGSLRKNYSRLRRAPLSAALVTLDAKTGAVRAYVGGDPRASSDEFDRVRAARRQPGSTIKPLLLLEALESCGPRKTLHAATRISDAPLSIERDGRVWSPQNFDSKNHGVVDLRSALRNSYNIPFVRMTRWCGWDSTARRLRSLGLPIEENAPPSFSLGAAEVTPLQLAQAYTPVATLGLRLTPYAIERVRRPSGAVLSRAKRRRKRVARASTAYLVRDLMRDAVTNGTGRAARISDVEVVGKTGTSSDLRDAWFVGQAGGLITVVWVGLDKGRLGLTGSRGAAPLWRRYMAGAVESYPLAPPRAPAGIVTRRVDPSSGLIRSRSGRDELFRRGAMPPRDRFWRRERALVIE